MVKPRENRVPMMLSDEELKSIDDWRFSNRVGTRSEAIRRLCQMAIILDSKLPNLHSKTKSFSAANSDFKRALLDLLKRVVDVSQEEIKNLARADIKSSEGFIELVLAVRELTGQAANFKDDRKLDDVMKESADLTEFFQDLRRDRPEV